MNKDCIFQITGERFNTSFGIMVIHREQELRISVGNLVRYEEELYVVEAVVSPSRPNGKFSLRLKAK